jgi:protein-S-isoprenylcysteine O-methyltransferase Ste14
VSVLVRAITYATLFIGFLLVFLPARVLAWSGIVRPAEIGPAQIAGIVLGAGGAALVRNPMYLGPALALGGAALFYRSWTLLAYCAAFASVTHLFVVG